MSATRLVSWGLMCGCLIAPSAPAALVHQYVATNFTGGGTAVWVDSVSGNDLVNAGAASTHPFLVSGATPTGKPAVQFNRTGGFGDGGRYLEFEDPLGAAFTTGPNFAIIAVLRDNTPDNSFGMVISGNQNGDLQLRMNGDNFGGQANVSRRNVLDIGDSATPTSTEFYVFGFTYNSASGNWAFYKNGLLDGSGNVGSQSFTSPELVGTGPGISLSFVGQIAELRLYNTSSIDVAAISAALESQYLIPEPTTFALLSLGSLLMWRVRRRNS